MALGKEVFEIAKKHAPNRTKLKGVRDPNQSRIMFLSECTFYPQTTNCGAKVVGGLRSVAFEVAAQNLVYDICWNGGVMFYTFYLPLEAAGVSAEAEKETQAILKRLGYEKVCEFFNIVHANERKNKGLSELWVLPLTFEEVAEIRKIGSVEFSAKKAA